MEEFTYWEPEMQKIYLDVKINICFAWDKDFTCCWRGGGGGGGGVVCIMNPLFGEAA